MDENKVHEWANMIKRPDVREYRVTNSARRSWPDRANATIARDEQVEILTARIKLAQKKPIEQNNEKSPKTPTTCQTVSTALHNKYTDTPPHNNRMDDHGATESGESEKSEWLWIGIEENLMLNKQLHNSGTSFTEPPRQKERKKI